MSAHDAALIRLLNYSQAKMEADRLWAVNTENSKRLNHYREQVMGPTTAGLGLTPDWLKADPCYRDLKAAFDRSHQQLRAYNQWYTKAFKREIRAARRAKR